jgi:diphthamide biosynthesis protein 2
MRKDELAERLKFSGMHVAVAKIESEIFIPGTQSIDKSSSKCSSSHFCGRHFIGVDSLNDIDHSYKILYVGRTRVFLDTLMMTFPRASGVYHFDPTITAAAADEGECILASSQMTRLLSKRYFNINYIILFIIIIGAARLLMIEKIRAATRIGILVGTLAVASYVDVIDSVQTLIEASDKRAHVVVVGKLNPAKLGNFMEIEVFVNVACPENSLIDGREFLQPIVTPFELYLALKPSTEGNDEASAVYERYILDFRRLLDDFRDYNVDVEQQKEEEEEQLISGQLARLNVHQWSN